MSTSIFYDQPRWLDGKGLRLQVGIQTPLSELTEALVPMLAEHPTATVALDYEADGCDGFGYHFIEVSW